MARIESITLNLDLRKKEDLDLYNEAMNKNHSIIYEGKKFYVTNIKIESFNDNFLVTATLLSAE